MAQIREIRKRIKAVRTIQRITKTMQMIATARFTAALQRAKATRPYTEKLSHLVAEVAAAAGDVQHPLIDGPAEKTGRELLLVISSDRGMCGAYNAHVLREAMGHARALRASNIELELETSGKKAVGFFKFQKVPIATRHALGDKPGYADIEPLAHSYLDRFAAGEFDAIRVAHMQFISNARQVSRIQQLLPLRPPVASDAAPTGAVAGYEFSPSSAELLHDLLPLAVKSELFQAFNDAIVSEQIMRMVAMKAATENANELGKILNRRYNRARQAQITTELMEVIGGAAALE